MGVPGPCTRPPYLRAQRPRYGHRLETTLRLCDSRIWAPFWRPRRILHTLDPINRPAPLSTVPHPPWPMWPPARRITRTLRLILVIITAAAAAAATQTTMFTGVAHRETWTPSLLTARTLTLAPWACSNPISWGDGWTISPGMCSDYSITRIWSMDRLPEALMFNEFDYRTAWRLGR